METYYTDIDTPIGTLLLVGNAEALTGIRFVEGRRAVAPDPGWKRASEPFREVIRQLEAYFAGDLREFDLPLAPNGTPFQQRVWRELRTIPYGTTISYLDVARRIGQPNAVRAVGAANGQNRIAIVIPCHRVIGADGSLTGFGGGIEVKGRLLRLEGARPTQRFVVRRRDETARPVAGEGRA